MKINYTIVLITILAVSLPGLLLAYVSYNTINDAVTIGIQERLMDRAIDWRITLSSYEETIKAQEINARKQAQSIILEESKIVFELIDYYLKNGDGTLSSDEKEDLLTRLSRHTVGKTGYIYILDYNGAYVLSKQRQRDGEYVWDVKAHNGAYPIRDIITKGKTYSFGDTGMYTYFWKNKSDIEEREKISSLIHVPQLEWIIGVTAYFDDVVDMQYRHNVMEDVKDLIARQKVGRSGYIAIMSKDAHYIVSKERVRDGEDISKSQDSKGNYFIQDGVSKAMAAGESADFITYPWKNKGEAKEREKVAAVTFYDDWEWVIWVSAYYDDFSTGQTLLSKLFMVLIISLLVCVFVSYEIGIHIRDIEHSNTNREMKKNETG